MVPSNILQSLRFTVGNLSMIEKPFKGKHMDIFIVPACESTPESPEFRCGALNNELLMDSRSHLHHRDYVCI